jgi:hypothetical protein
MGSMNAGSARIKSQVLARESVPNDAARMGAIGNQMLMRTV